MALLTMLLYAFITSFTPGPNNIMALVFANRSGFKKTLRFCLGVGTGFFALIILSCYFNLLLQNVIPKIEFVMTIIGVVYMLYLATKIITSNMNDEDDSENTHNRFWTGVLLQFVNPKAILYAITVISTFVLPYHTSNSNLLFYAVVLAFIGFMGTFSWSVFGSVFNKFLSKYRRPFNVIMALLLVYSAVSILLE